MIYLTLWPHCVWSTGWGIWSCSGTPPIWYQRPVYKRRRIMRNKGFLSILTWTRWSRLTYIRTNSFNSIGYFGEGIVQCWDVGDDWFFIRRLDVNIWWETYKPRGHEWQQTRASCTLSYFSWFEWLCMWLLPSGSSSLATPSCSATQNASSKFDRLVCVDTRLMSTRSGL